jgi:uncharacterized OB-fold protein
VTEGGERIVDRSDPTTESFWSSAREGRLLIQRCRACRRYQFYPRPFCLVCDSEEIDEIPASGLGTVYSRTTVHLDAAPELGLKPPYIVAIVELDEGPRLLTNLTSDACRIGTRVQVVWRPRGGQPPVPVFGPLYEAPETGRR